LFFFFQAEDGIRDRNVTGVQKCALPIYLARFSSMWILGGQATMLALPVAHRLVAALILAATAVLAVRVNATAGSNRESELELSRRLEPLGARNRIGASNRINKLDQIGTMNAATPYPSLSPTVRAGRSCR